MENPNSHMIKNVAISETGMSIKGLKAIAQSLKNKYIIKITRNIELLRFLQLRELIFLQNSVVKGNV
jgi:hypothetical protein